MKKIVLRFEDWLVDHQYREDLIGDLACVPSMQHIVHRVTRRRYDEHKNWVEIVIKLAEPRYIAAFNEAWQEFLLAKQATKDALD